MSVKFLGTFEAKLQFKLELMAGSVDVTLLPVTVLIFAFIDSGKSSGAAENADSLYVRSGDVKFCVKSSPTLVNAVEERIDKCDDDRSTRFAPCAKPPIELLIRLASDSGREKSLKRLSALSVT